MPKQNSLVTVVDNETGKETTGYLIEYTPDNVIIKALVQFDAKRVHFKDKVNLKINKG